MARADAKKRETENEPEWETIEAGAITPWEKGLKVQGFYVGMKETQGQFAKINYLLKLRVGSQVETFGCPAILRSRMESILTGEEVRITCQGKAKTKGGNQAWDFTVQRRKAL